MRFSILEIINRQLIISRVRHGNLSIAAIFLRKSTVPRASFVHLHFFAAFTVQGVESREPQTRWKGRRCMRCWGHERIDACSCRERRFKNPSSQRSACASEPRATAPALPEKELWPRQGHLCTNFTACTERRKRCGVMQAPVRKAEWNEWRG